MLGILSAPFILALLSFQVMKSQVTPTRPCSPLRLRYSTSHVLCCRGDASGSDTCATAAVGLLTLHSSAPGCSETLCPMCAVPF